MQKYTKAVEISNIGQNTTTGYIYSSLPI